MSGTSGAGGDGGGGGEGGGRCMTEKRARAGLVPIKAAAPPSPPLPKLYRRLSSGALGWVSAATSRDCFSHNTLLGGVRLCLGCHHELHPLLTIFGVNHFLHN